MIRATTRYSLLETSASPGLAARHGARARAAGARPPARRLARARPPPLRRRAARLPARPGRARADRAARRSGAPSPARRRLCASGSCARCPASSASRRRSPARPRSRTPRRSCARSRRARSSSTSRSTRSDRHPADDARPPARAPEPAAGRDDGLGLALRLWRDELPARDGGTAILLHGFKRHFAHPTQVPYRDFFQATRLGRDPEDRARPSARSQATSARSSSTAQGRACHPLLPFADWDACQPALSGSARSSSPAAGTRPRRGSSGSSRRTRSSAALEMAHGRAGSATHASASSSRRRTSRSRSWSRS